VLLLDPGGVHASVHIRQASEVLTAAGPATQGPLSALLAIIRARRWPHRPGTTTAACAVAAELSLTNVELVAQSL
jgi:hypothetical protein